MSRRVIGRERFGFTRRERARSSFDGIAALVAWEPIAVLLEPLYPAAKGEPAWPPPAMFKALLLAVWYDLADVKLADHAALAARVAVDQRQHLVVVVVAATLLLASGLDRLLAANESLVDLDNATARAERHVQLTRAHRLAKAMREEPRRL